MNIFIWQSYGNTNAYKADTAEDIRVVVARVGAAIDKWGLDAQFYQTVTSVEMFVSTVRGDRARRELVAFVRQHCRDTDAFELFETTRVQ